MANNTDNIQVKDPAAAIASCQKAATIITALDANITELQSLTSKINTAWSSDGLDQQSYMQNLAAQTDRLTRLEDFMKQIFGIIQNYSESVQKTSNTTLDAVVGESIGDYKVGTGYRTSNDSIHGTNGVTLNKTYINSDNSKIKGFVILDENGRVKERITNPGVSVADYAQQNNIDIDRIAIDIGSNDGVSQAWVPATDFE